MTEFKDVAALKATATLAAQQWGYARMWSIHPTQIEAILTAFSPQAAEVHMACELIQTAQAAQWSPISYQGTLHDRASYRYYWQVLEQAYATGVALPDAITQTYFTKDTA